MTGDEVGVSAQGCNDVYKIVRERLCKLDTTRLPQPTNEPSSLQSKTPDPQTHHVQPVGVQELRGRAGAPARNQEGPLAAARAGGVLPLGLDAFPEQVNVGAGGQARRRENVVVQAANK